MQLPGRSFLPMVLRHGHPVLAFDLLRMARHAERIGDEQRILATHWDDFIALLQLSRDAQLAAEIGTGNAWGSILLAKAHRGRLRMVTVDPIVQQHRDVYVRMMGAPGVEFWAARGDEGPRDLRDIDLLFIDSSHSYEDTIAEFHAWEPAVRAGGHVAFHDHGSWPDVERAVRDLELTGEVRGLSLFVWRKPG